MAERFAAAAFVHGAGGGGWEWNVWTRLFAAHGLAVAAPDLAPAAGGLARTGLDDYAGQVRAALTALARPRVLVGASLGGLLAARVAEAADALVLIDPMPPAPFHAGLPARARYPEVVPWRREASLAGTRRALPEADDATALYAFRRWRDESGAVLDTARAGVDVARPACPVLVLASADDADVPPSLSEALAVAWGADLIRLRGSHVAPLLGRGAAGAAAQVLAWLNDRS